MQYQTGQYHFEYQLLGIKYICGFYFLILVLILSVLIELPAFTVPKNLAVASQSSSFPHSYYQISGVIKVSCLVED